MLFSGKVIPCGKTQIEHIPESGSVGLVAEIDFRHPPVIEREPEPPLRIQIVVTRYSRYYDGTEVELIPETVENYSRVQVERKLEAPLPEEILHSHGNGYEAVDITVGRK